jgi:hypothetical protein
MNQRRDYSKDKLVTVKDFTVTHLEGGKIRVSWDGQTNRLDFDSIEAVQKFAEFLLAEVKGETKEEKEDVQGLPISGDR